MTKEEKFMLNGDGIRLKTLRNNMGLTVTEFSVKTNINSSFINLLEKGCLPLSNRDKRKISEAFGLEENWCEQVETSSSVENPVKSNEDTSICNSVIADVNVPYIIGEKDYRTQIFINNGESLKTTRITLGLSRKALGESIGITSVQIGYIETGKRTLTDKVRNRLNSYFNTFPKELYDLILETNEMTSNIITYEEQLAEKSNDPYESDNILNKLKLLKKIRGYTQSEVSIKSGVNRGQLSLIENGKMQMSQKVKIKLLNFISSEFEEKKHKTENIITTKVISSPPDENLPLIPQKINPVSTVKVTNNKSELLKVINSMKKTRDELQNNIDALEQTLSNMSV